MAQRKNWSCLPVDMVSGHDATGNVGFLLQSDMTEYDDFKSFKTVQSNNMEGFVVKFEGDSELKLNLTICTPS